MSEMEASKTPPNVIPWREQLEDHTNKIEEYLQNCLFRGCSEATLHERKAILRAIFLRVKIDDSNHPAGRRHLLVWDLLNPVVGSYWLGLIVSSLSNDDLAPASRRKYLTELSYFCDYVLAKPHVPGGNGLSLIDKYGPMVSVFTKYDLPIHAADRPVRKRYALAPSLLNEFFEFLRVEFLPNQSLPHMGARNYVAIVVHADIGARSSELLGIRWGSENCDVDLIKGRVRLFGKGSPYSGKRLRWVPLTPLAAEVLYTFQKVFKPMFPKSPYSDYVFLNKDGSRLTKFWYWKTFRKIVALARDAGVQVPEDLRPHDLRRTYATNQLEQNPLAYRKVLKRLGHTYPSSIAPYLIATDEDVEEDQEDLIDIFINPWIDKKGED